MVNDGDLTILKIGTDDNIADLLTKNLGWIKYIKFRSMLLKEIGSIEGEVREVDLTGNQGYVLW